ncbi:tRNA (adenosine(37)-N6)-threonylcarbamoyltransferase complex dimerization subunit type 1 TsaB [Rhodothermus bifroesti]|uniref:tRNA (Adenosine(37)-N6)-threonylcarbamoyltransferase complex dimerization subunit type 1 TsaB n=1 Tax=Rhodothermus marinus TaxID=29549 RepID=A0A7V2AYU0_RHOMR|nr:tRNA (adenosine(37)-N6)-threonylcarbamoyltransferase complex dimerization subunit type 1 TsaB [Rhodothermus bifroesti]GBD00730.1 tRNA threonylcarbamoyladenosine biosynthesis protein TsaB [bacterium HR18]
MKSLLLALETATEVCSVALLNGDSLYFEATLQQGRIHAERLAPLIATALEHSGVQAAELQAVAVSMGPGSYTGLRVGVSTAKGLCEATNAALIGVPTLEALAASVMPYAEPEDVIIPLLNSRRSEVYAAAYRIGPENTLHPLAKAVAYEAAELASWLEALGLNGRLHLVGEGTTRVAPYLPKQPGLRLLDPHTHLMRAFWVGRLGWRRYQQGQIADVASFEPLYLKDFVVNRATPQASLTS